MNKRLKIYVNFKRFDIPEKFGGINRSSAPGYWAEDIIRQTSSEIRQLSDSTEFMMFFPESHVQKASEAKNACNSSIDIGCQGVFRDDVSLSGNFGAFTANRTAKAMIAHGVTGTLIGHCEERKDKKELLLRGLRLSNDIADTESAFGMVSNEINKIMNEEIICALKAGMRVLYCVGENSDEQNDWEAVIAGQLEHGLADIDRSLVTIAYEPIWAIGPGKTPPDRAYIEKIAGFIKDKTGGMDVVYGGGLKSENAQMLASIDDISGGLIALTRFSGEIGFYPDEFLEIARKFIANKRIDKSSGGTI